MATALDRAAVTNWIEWEGIGVDGNFVFLIDSWRDDNPSERTLLARTLKDIGVTSSIANAQKMAESCELKHAYYGYPEGELFPEICDSRGFTCGDVPVDIARTCTFAILRSNPVP